jgi:membrane carboxypeptidase/penicillin-binding protein
MVNIRGYEQINGENFPLDIWSVYMQNVVGRYPVQQFAKPSEEFLEGLREDKVGIPPDEREDAETTAQETTASETTASETTAESTNSGSDTEGAVQDAQDFLDSLEPNRTEPAVSPERQRRQQPQQPQQQRRQQPQQLQQQRQQQPATPQRSGAGANQPGVQPNVAPQNAAPQRPSRNTRPGSARQRDATPRGVRPNQPAAR